VNGLDGHRLEATGSALELLARLEGRHGPVSLHLSGGCCDGSSPICLLAGELVLGQRDLLLGEIAGTAVYIDRDQFARWNAPDVLIDASPGPAEGFSLDSLEDAHLILRGLPGVRPNEGCCL
jgi:uncharacterized protein (DUF779 family)